jgi:hypothetical protein
MAAVRKRYNDAMIRLPDHGGASLEFGSAWIISPSN